MPTIDSVLQRAASSAPDRTAVREWGGLEMTYAQLDAAVSSFAAWARAKGVREDDAIAVHLPSTAAFLIAQLGSSRAGAVAAYINYRLMPNEARRQFSMCKARVVVTTPDKAAEFVDDPQFSETLFVVDGEAEGRLTGLQDIIEANHRTDFRPEGREDSDAIIRFTSGSTGAPKGLIVTHRAWLIRAQAMQAETMQVQEGSTTLLLGQLSHQAGLFVIPTLLARATVLLMPKFSLDAVAEILSTQQVSCAQIVPTMFTLLLEHPRARAAATASGVKRIIYGGSPIRPAVLEEAMSVFPDTEFVQAYGSHEGGSISFLDSIAHRDPKLRHGAGVAYLPAQVRLHAPGPDGVGEIEVNAPWVPCARLTLEGRETITNPWTRTGDIGEIVDGHLFLRDRMNDVIISGGFNVYPMEVEQVVCGHPQVLDAAITSAPDDKWGERVVAFVVPRNAGVFDEESVREHCRSLLAGYKVPKEFRLIPEMPLNPNGKPDRRALGDSLWAGRARRIN